MSDPLDPRRSVTLVLETGTPRRAWCSRCLLPSVIEIDLFHLQTNGVSSMGTYRRCVDCGGRSEAAREVGDQ